MPSSWKTVLWFLPNSCSPTAACSTATGYGYDCTPEALTDLRTYVDALPRDRSFGNARTARQILETMTTRQAGRIGALPAPGLDDLRTLLPEDLPSTPAPRATQ